MDLLLKLIGDLKSIYYWMIIIYVLMSWVPSIRASFVGKLLGKLVEPYLALFRKIIPPLGGMIDISPIVSLFALNYAVLGLQSIIIWAFGH